MLEYKNEGFSIRYTETRLDRDSVLEHYHDSYEVVFFIKADLQLFLKNRQYHIEDGDLLLINEYDIHKINYQADKSYIRYVVNFKKSFIESFLDANCAGDMLAGLEKLDIRKTNLGPGSRYKIDELFKVLLNTYEKYLKKPTDIMQNALRSVLFILLINLTEQLGRADAGVKEQNKKDAQVKALIKFIDSNYMNQITLATLEQELYLSKYYISRIFKQVSGFSVIEYIQYRRIIEAQKMLKSSKKDIVDICYDCGFNTLQQFYITFKKISLTTPYQYRTIKLC
jgi:AraC-like DNA-binding protein